MWWTETWGVESLSGKNAMVDIRCYGPEYHFLDLSLFLLLCKTEFYFKRTPVIAVATWSHFKKAHVAWLINSETLIRLTASSQIAPYSRNLSRGL